MSTFLSVLLRVFGVIICMGLGLVTGSTFSEWLLKRQILIPTSFKGVKLLYLITIIFFFIFYTTVMFVLIF